MDIPLDASPKYRALCERIKHALETHGTLNTYYLYNAACIFHLTNDDERGMLRFRFRGTLFTDELDQQTLRSDLEVDLLQETCDWITEPVVKWCTEAVRRAVAVEFDRYIAEGDLAQTKKRIENLQAESDCQGGFVGMYL